MALDGRRSGDWPTVVLLGGASGVGKSQLSYALARHLGSAVVEVDDLVVAVQSLTDASEHPVLHQWLRQDGTTRSVDEVVDAQIRFAVAMEPAVTAVVHNHLETNTPVVIEGDYIVARRMDNAAVRTVLVHEDDLDQLVCNYQAREPESGEQVDRARASLAYGRWLTGQANATGVPVLPARPWRTAFDRLLETLGV
ncbi:MAG: hypothetical protein M3Y44_00250 [Actinomycetota bacterium]|nr:hypothetical protein [Actinomycetota bacterium]